MQPSRRRRVVDKRRYFLLQGCLDYVRARHPALYVRMVDEAHRLMPNPTGRKRTL